MTKTEKPIEKLTAQECQERLDAIEARFAEIREWRDRHKPPKPQPSGPRYGRDVDILEGASPEYRRIMLEGTPEEGAEMERQREALETEGAQLAVRRDHLERRKKQAEHEEELGAAPKRLEARRKELPEKLDHAEAAVREARDALVGLEEWLRAVHQDRDLLEDDTRFLEPAELHRLGVLLRHRVVEKDEWTVMRDGAERKVPAIFNSPEQARKAVDLLGAPDQSWFQRLLKAFGLGDESRRRPQDERRVRAQVNEERVKFLAAGRPEDVDDGQAVGEAAVSTVSATERAARDAKQFIV